MTNTQRAHRKGRHLILVDIENLVASPNPTVRAVEAAATALRGALPDFDTTQLIVSCSHHAAPTVAFSFPRARHLWRSGPDGADLALLDVLNREQVDQRFEFVTICSGDGIFAASACCLAAAGVDVTVVSVKAHLSARLELAARRVLALAPIASVASGESAG
jgi:hypothetical protein